eukprot:jgi/Botrbrau1/9706/Bobra.0388s0001.1
MLLRPVQDENSLGPSGRVDADDLENVFAGIKSLQGRTKSFGSAPRKALGNITNRPTKQLANNTAKTPLPSTAQRKALGDITNGVPIAKPLLTPVPDAKPLPPRTLQSQVGLAPAVQQNTFFEEPEQLLGRSWNQLESLRIERDRAELTTRVHHILGQRTRYPVPPLPKVAKQRETDRVFMHLEVAVERPASPPLSPICKKGGSFMVDESPDIFISSCDIKEEELVFDVSQEDPLEVHFSDPQQNYGSPPQLTNEPTQLEIK